MDHTLRFQDPDCRPFVIQCNASDIFTDVTVLLEYNGETAEFSPFISLKDGSVMIGERGLDLTKPGIAIGGDTDPYVGEYWDGTQADLQNSIINTGGARPISFGLALFHVYEEVFIFEK